jgi:predicted nucleic-acid-binding protein
VLGIDTNVLLRLLIEDDPRQSAASRRLAASFSRTEPGFLNLIVLVEASWVLRQTYGYTREQIATAFDGLLVSDGLVMEDPAAVEEAVELFRQTSIDFADALIVVRNRAAGCATTVTFDQALARTSLARAP